MKIIGLYEFSISDFFKENISSDLRLHISSAMSGYRWVKIVRTSAAQSKISCGRKLQLRLNLLKPTKRQGGFFKPRTITMNVAIKESPRMTITFNLSNWTWRTIQGKDSIITWEECKKKRMKNQSWSFIFNILYK